MPRSGGLNDSAGDLSVHSDFGIQDFLFWCDKPIHPVDPIRKLGLGSNIGHVSFVEGWVKNPDNSCWVSFLDPTYLSGDY
jgi:hypothetical protein